MKMNQSSEKFIIWGDPFAKNNYSYEHFQAVISAEKMSDVLDTLEKFFSSSSNKILPFEVLCLGLLIHTDSLRLLAGSTGLTALEHYKQLYQQQIIQTLLNSSTSQQSQLVSLLGRIIRQEVHQGWPVYDKVSPGNLVISWLRETLTSADNQLLELISDELLLIISSTSPLISKDTRGEAAELFLQYFENYSPKQKKLLILKLHNATESINKTKNNYFVTEKRDPDFSRYYLPHSNILKELKEGQATVQFGTVQGRAHGAIQRDTTLDPMPRLPLLSEKSPFTQEEKNAHLIWHAAKCLAAQQVFIDVCRLLHRLGEDLKKEWKLTLEDSAITKQGYFTHPEAEQLVMRECPAPNFRTVLDYVVHPLQIVASDGIESYTLAMVAKLASEPSISGAHTAFARLAIQAFGHSALGFQDASFLGMESKANWVPHGEDRPVILRIGKAAVWGKGAIASLNAGGFWAKRTYFGSWFTGIRIHDHLHGSQGSTLGRLGIVPFMIIVDLPDKAFPPIPGYYEMADFVKADKKLHQTAGKRSQEIPGFYSLKVLPSTLQLTAAHLL